jgi:osmotically-inducible protein OsmY
MKTDLKIQKSVVEELQYEPAIDASDIGVTCKNGIVTLTGTVKSYADKELAVCRLERFPGVRALVDQINVELPEQHERTDQDIAEAALRGLQWHVQVPDTQLRVKVEKGIVSLEGEVEHKYEETAAKNAVRDLMGVQGVVSLIRVKEAVSSFQIKKNIQSALRRAELDARRIKVAVHDNHVTLSGTVSTREDRVDAERAAWTVDGVLEVKDNLNVAA